MGSAIDSASSIAGRYRETYLFALLTSCPAGKRHVAPGVAVPLHPEAAALRRRNGRTPAGGNPRSWPDPCWW